MIHIHIDIPHTIVIPPRGRNDDDGSTRRFDLDTSRGYRANDSPSGCKKDLASFHLRHSAVDTQLKTVGVGLTTEIRLVCNSMWADPNGNGGVQADAGTQPGVRIWTKRGLGSNRRLADLDFHVFVPQKNEFTRA